MPLKHSTFSVKPSPAVFLLQTKMLLVRKDLVEIAGNTTTTTILQKYITKGQETGMRSWGPNNTGRMQTQESRKESRAAFNPFTQQPTTNYTFNMWQLLKLVSILNSGVTEARGGVAATKKKSI